MIWCSPKTIELRRSWKFNFRICHVQKLSYKYRRVLSVLLSRLIWKCMSMQIDVVTPIHNDYILIQGEQVSIIITINLQILIKFWLIYAHLVGIKSEFSKQLLYISLSHKHKSPDKSLPLKMCFFGGNLWTTSESTMGSVCNLNSPTHLLTL